MSSSRECLVCMVDDSSFTVPIKSTLLGSELLDLSASHANIKEKEYFGLFTEGDGFKNWLELDKAVLDQSQDLPKGSQQIKIYFAFKYFVDDIRLLHDYMTVEMLYLQSRQAIMKEEIITDDETVFELAACAMQSHFGEMKTEQDARQRLNSFPVIPAHVFKRIAIAKCEERVNYYYNMMRSMSRGDAVIKYVEIIQSLPMYSIHYFEVKDKKDVHLWLGVGPDGICQCSQYNRNDPECRFQWLQLQNIYYRDKKFSMEVYQNSKPNKKGVGFGPVVVYAWHGSNPKVVMAIWKMARDQHMFYRSKRTNKNAHAGMNLTEMTRQLSKLHKSNISPCSSQSSISMESAKSTLTQASAEAMAAAKAAQSDMYSALLARRQALMSEFETKAAQYKEILVKEMHITGIPPEGLTAEEIEKMRKKFGVSFKFSKFVLDERPGDGDEVDELEKQLEIQSSIIEASKTLLGQANNRKLKKDRKKEIRKMEDKYMELEQKLTELKRSSRGSTMSGGTRFYGDSPVSSPMYNTPPGSVPVSRRRSGTPGGASIDDSILATMIFDTPPKQGGSGSVTGSNSGGNLGVGVGGPGSANLQKSPHHKSTSALSDVQTNNSTSSSSSKRTLPTGGYLASSHGSTTAHAGRASTLAVTESSSYLSSIGGGGYADDYEGPSPTSSGFNSANASFTSSNFSGNHYSTYGHGSGNNLRGNFDLADDILQHFAGSGSGGGSHSSSPTGYPTSSHNTSSYHGYRSEVASGSPVTHYKRASSPTLKFPTENQQSYIAGHGERGGSGQRHISHAQDIKRSHSPDVQHHHLMGGYSASYNPPSMLNQPNAYQHHQYQQQSNVVHQNPGTRGGGVSPTMYVQGHMGTTGGRDVQYSKAGGWIEDRKSPVQRYGQGGDSLHGMKLPSNSQGRQPSSKDSSAYKGSRKASDQEMGIMEALNMMDKRSASANKFDDGTLV